MIDRKRVRHAFGKQAGEYESHASVQKRVLARLVDILQGESLAPRRILDIGSGTGMLLRTLRGVYGDAWAVGVDHAVGMNIKARKCLGNDGRAHVLAADAEQLPFSPSSFDLVLSTSTFQWLEHPGVAFGEAFRVLVPGGLFCFALFGEGTLHELRNSYRYAAALNGGPENRVHTFLTGKQVASALRQAGFASCRVTSRMEVEFHENVPALLRSLKRIGAGNASPVRGRGLAGKRTMLAMMERYRHLYGGSNGIPASYEVIYGLGWKGGTAGEDIKQAIDFVFSLNDTGAT